MFLLVLSLFGFHGIISNDTAWADTAHLTGDVWVDSGVTLTIDPGTVVLYADSCQWDKNWTREGLNSIERWTDVIIEGNMNAIGTLQDSIWFGDGSGKAGNLLLADGVDSLEYVSLKIGRADISRCIGTGLVGVEVSISHCEFEGGYGILGYESVLTLTNTDFHDLIGMSYLYGSGSGNLIELHEGNLYVDSCVFSDAVEMFGAVISVENLDSFLLRDTRIEGISGFDAQQMGVPDAGGNAGGCYCKNCEYVEISNNELQGFGGGSSTGSCGNGFPGARAYGLFISNCIEGLITNNVISGIHGGSGGSASYSDGGGGDGLGVQVWDCSDLRLTGNTITNLSGGQPGSEWGESDASEGEERPIVCYNSSLIITNNEFNSAGRHIYIDESSQPIIGGSPGKGNRFLSLADKEYVIYNDSPYDIDATWNFWECAPALIDSLIFDYYDDETKGIVHYQPIAGIEEKDEQPSKHLLSVPPIVTSDVLEVRLYNPQSEEIGLSLFDAAGRRFQRMSIRASRASLDVSALPSGVYFVSARVGERSSLKKVILY